MKTTQITLLTALFFFAIACNSSAPESSENIETADSTQVVDEVIEEKDIDIVKEEICSLSSDYFGNWTWDQELSEINCEWGFRLFKDNNFIYIRNGSRGK